MAMQENTFLFKCLVLLDCCRNHHTVFVYFLLLLSQEKFVGGEKKVTCSNLSDDRNTDLFYCG